MTEPTPDAPVAQATSAQKTAQSTAVQATEAGQQANNKPNQHARGGLFAKLSQAGQKLADIYAKPAHKPRAPVDLSRRQFNQDAFRAQSAKMSHTLLGAKAMGVAQMAAKGMGDDKAAAISEAVYAKIADWARAWAVHDLRKDERFARLYRLSDSERQALATDAKNRNRVLVSVSAVAGFMGLKGVVLDTAWLLLVSLKSVYALSMVYNQPLTGVDGARLAYGILSACELEKMQEKQVIMTALALGDGVLKNAQSTSLIDELKKMSAANPAYVKQLEQLAGRINLDRFNPRWLHHLLPMGSVLIAAHYNNELLEEVLSVAEVSFAPPPLLNQEDSHKEVGA